MAGSISIGKGGITFGNKAPMPEQPMQSPFSASPQPLQPGNMPVPNITDDMNNANRRLKMLEERYTNTRSKFQVIEQNMLHKNKTFFTEIKTLNLEIIEIKKEINELKDKMVSLIKEMDSFARKDSVDILKKYIDLWNPVNFVTRNEVEQIVQEVIDRLRKQNSQR